jgi:hypothetical protein
MLEVLEVHMLAADSGHPPPAVPLGLVRSLVRWCGSTLKKLHLVTPVQITTGIDDPSPFRREQPGDPDRAPLERLILDTRSDPRVLGILYNLWWAYGGVSV